MHNSARNDIINPNKGGCVMKYKNLKNSKAEHFRRITGVKRETFEKMTEILKTAEEEIRIKGGPKPHLSIENRLLAALEYLREYRTYAHIAVDYSVSESQMYRIIKWVEDVLIKNGTFSLPGRKEVQKSDTLFEIIMIDATESPIERPKKNKRNTIPEKSEDTQ